MAHPLASRVARFWLNKLTVPALAASVRIRAYQCDDVSMAISAFNEARLAHPFGCEDRIFKMAILVVTDATPDVRPEDYA